MTPPPLRTHVIRKRGFSSLLRIHRKALRLGLQRLAKSSISEWLLPAASEATGMLRRSSTSSRFPMEPVYPKTADCNLRVPLLLCITAGSNRIGFRDRRSETLSKVQIPPCRNDLPEILYVELPFTRTSTGLRSALKMLPPARKGQA